MRKLSTLVLLALLASPAFSLSSNTTISTIPKTDGVLWIALGTMPVAVSVSSAIVEDDMVTICYYGVTLTVSEKIAKRYLKIGARCGSCDRREIADNKELVGESRVCGKDREISSSLQISSEGVIQISTASNSNQPK